MLLTMKSSGSTGFICVFVKLSLDLTKYQAMKMYPVLN